MIHITTRRVAVRLPDTTINAIDDLAARTKRTRTDIITDALAQLQRGLAFGRVDIGEDLLAQRQTAEHTRPIQCRLPILLTNYYNINCITLTTAIRFALKRYIL